MKSLPLVAGLAALSLAGCTSAGSAGGQAAPRAAAAAATVEPCKAGLEPTNSSPRVVTCPAVIDERTLAYTYAHSSNCPTALPPVMPSAHEVDVRFRTRGVCLLNLIVEMNHRIHLPSALAPGSAIVVVVHEDNSGKQRVYRYRVTS